MTLSLASCGALTKQTAAGPESPSITDQPTSQMIGASQTATFSVAAVGTPPLHYQWTKNGNAIRGATLAWYTTPVMTPSDSGTHFAVVVRNSKGAAVSTAATLTVNTPGRLNASASFLKFGNVAMDNSISLPVTLAAAGNSQVAISNVSISGPGFNVSGISAGLVLAPGEAKLLNVSFTPAARGSVVGSITISSDASNPSAIISLTGSGVQPIVHSVSLTLSPDMSNIIGYNVYRSSVSGGPYAKVTPSLDTTSSFTDMNVQAGQTYYYVATSVDSNNIESAHSNEVSATIPSY